MNAQVYATEADQHGQKHGEHHEVKAYRCGGRSSRKESSDGQIGNRGQRRMAAGKTRRKDACRRGDDIRSLACEHEFEQVVERNAAPDREQHQPGDAGLVSQEEISGNRGCRDYDDDDAAQTGNIARRFLCPGWADGARWVDRALQGQGDAAVERRRFSSGDPAGDEAK